MSRPVGDDSQREARARLGRDERVRDQAWPGRRSPQADADAGKPKQLRKRLRKAEDQLADAQLKRDRAQARVEALSIIADEIRAQLAEADTAPEEASAAGGATKAAARRAPARKRSATSARTAGSRAAARSAASAASEPPPATSPRLTGRLDCRRDRLGQEGPFRQDILVVQEGVAGQEAANVGQDAFQQAGRGGGLTAGARASMPDRRVRTLSRSA